MAQKRVKAPGPVWQLLFRIESLRALLQARDHGIAVHLSLMQAALLRHSRKIRTIDLGHAEWCRPDQHKSLERRAPSALPSVPAHCDASRSGGEDDRSEPRRLLPLPSDPGQKAGRLAARLDVVVVRRSHVEQDSRAASRFKGWQRGLYAT